MRKMNLRMTVKPPPATNEKKEGLTKKSMIELLSRSYGFDEEL